MSRNTQQLSWLQNKLKQHKVPVLLDDSQGNLSPPSHAIPYLSLLAKIEPSIPPTLSKYLQSSYASYETWVVDDKLDSFWLLGRWLKSDFDANRLVDCDGEHHSELIEKIQEKYFSAMENEEILQKTKERMEKIKERNKDEKFQTRISAGSSPSDNRYNQEEAKDKLATSSSSSTDKPIRESFEDRVDTSQHNGIASGSQESHISPRSSPHQGADTELNVQHSQASSQQSHVGESTDLVNVSMSVNELNQVKSDLKDSDQAQKSESPTTTRSRSKKRASSFVQSQHLADMRHTVHIGSSSPPEELTDPQLSDSLSVARESMKSLKHSLKQSPNRSSSPMIGTSKSIDESSDDESSDSAHSNSAKHSPNVRHSANVSTDLRSSKRRNSITRSKKLPLPSRPMTAEMPDDDLMDESSDDYSEDIPDDMEPLKFSSPIADQSGASQHSNTRYANSSVDTLVKQSTLYDRYMKNRESGSKLDARESINSLVPSKKRSGSVLRTSFSDDKSDDMEPHVSESDTDSGDDEVVSSDDDEIEALEHATRESFGESVGQSLELSDDDFMSAKSIRFNSIRASKINRYANDESPQLDPADGPVHSSSSSDVQSEESIDREMNNEKADVIAQGSSSDESNPSVDLGEEYMERPPTPETYEELSMLPTQWKSKRPSSAGQDSNRDEQDEDTVTDVLNRDFDQYHLKPERRRSFSDITEAAKDADFSDMDKIVPPKTASGSNQQLRKENNKLRYMLFDFKKRVKQERRYLSQKLQHEKQQLHERIVKDYRLGERNRQSVRKSKTSRYRSSARSSTQASTVKSSIPSSTRSSVRSSTRSSIRSNTEERHPQIEIQQDTRSSHSSLQSSHKSSSPKSTLSPKMSSRSVTKSNSYAEIHSPTRVEKVHASFSQVPRNAMRKSIPKEKLMTSRYSSTSQPKNPHSEDTLIDNASPMPTNDTEEDRQSNESEGEVVNRASSSSSNPEENSYLAMYQKDRHSFSASDVSSTSTDHDDAFDEEYEEEDNKTSSQRLFITELNESKIPEQQKPANEVIEILPEDVRQSQEAKARKERMKRFEQRRNQFKQQQQKRRTSNTPHEPQPEHRPEPEYHAEEAPRHTRRPTQATTTQHDTGATKPAKPERTTSRVNMSRSNKLLIQNAIRHVCLAGFVNQDEQKEVLRFLRACHYSHFLILVREAKAPAFRGLYAFTDNDQIPEKIYGRGPKHLKPEYVKHFFRYDSARKKFSEISHAKTFSGTMDGMCLNEEAKRRLRRKPSVV